MSEAEIRAQIKTILAGVSGIGAVHDYERYSNSWADFLKIMTSGGKVNGWMIHRQVTKPERKTMPIVERYHTYKISGIYELDDAAASENDFQAILESIFHAFVANDTLNGTVLTSDPLFIDDVDTEEYGKTLYHTAELTLVVHDRVTYT